MPFKYPNILKSIILGAFLLVPFLLRFINGDLEVYPAVLFPSGASKVNVRDTVVNFNKYNLYGFDLQTHNKKLLDAEQFISPIPLRYLPGIIEHNFGLDSIQIRKIYIRKLNIYFESSLSFTFSERNRTKKWLKLKLQEQTCSDSLILLNITEEKFNPSTKRIDSSVVIYEKIFQLY